MASEKKNARDIKTAERLFNVIAKLPTSYSEQVKEEYQSVYQLLRATGVDRQALFRLNGNSAKQMELIVAAIKRRE